MLLKNAKKIVLKLGSATVVDSKGTFKKKWVTSLIKDLKNLEKEKTLLLFLQGQSLLVKSISK